MTVDADAVVMSSVDVRMWRRAVGIGGKGVDVLADVNGCVVMVGMAW